VLLKFISFARANYAMKYAYGGVVINSSGEVLLREPADHYKGHVWTFAKGKPQPGETPEETALREVLEETGVRARIIEKIPGVFSGATTSNEYFLMAPLENTGTFDTETFSIKWVSKQEAKDLISLTHRPNRRRRDLRVLKLAYRMYFERQSGEHPVGLGEQRAPGEEPPESVHASECQPGSALVAPKTETPPA
jgi:8-oxo-dGTP pyrophosphatase MutT (NUDIX family)